MFSDLVDFLKEILSIDCPQVSFQIQEFIAEVVGSAGADGVVVGLSGGLDSSVTAFLAVRALGSSKVTGLLTGDSRVTPNVDVQDARKVADVLGIEVKEVDIASVHDAFLKFLPSDRLSEGNLRARIRMCIAYYYANLLNRLVIGTGDRSEALLGYFTKYGDGGVDLLPLGCLYKTQVRVLAKWLGVPASVTEKKSSPRLWVGHEAEDELGVSYDVIDQVLYLVFDRSMSVSETASTLGIAVGNVQALVKRHSASNHKRSMPEISRVA